MTKNELKMYTITNLMGLGIYREELNLYYEYKKFLHNYAKSIVYLKYINLNDRLSNQRFYYLFISGSDDVVYFLYNHLLYIGKL